MQEKDQSTVNVLKKSRNGNRKEGKYVPKCQNILQKTALSSVPLSSCCLEKDLGMDQSEAKRQACFPQDVEEIPLLVALICHSAREN